LWQTPGPPTGLYDGRDAPRQAIGEQEQAESVERATARAS
jgi:hypothetical protein